MPEFLYEDETSEKILLYYATDSFLNATKVNYKIPPSQRRQLQEEWRKNNRSGLFPSIGNFNIQSLFIERQAGMTLMWINRYDNALTYYKESFGRLPSNLAACDLLLSFPAKLG